MKNIEKRKVLFILILYFVDTACIYGLHCFVCGNILLLTYVQFVTYQSIQIPFLCITAQYVPPPIKFIDFTLLQYKYVLEISGIKKELFFSV